ncbi:MAG: hypothetical protein KAG66_10995, partial [Methylococcales bacterium]|nr:hypothetical protein [Methylococcales bacterium]
MTFILALGGTGMLYSQGSYSWDWGRALTSKSMYVEDMAGDASGNVYICGYFSGDFFSLTDSFFAHGSGIQHAFVARVNQKGNLQWVRFLESDYGATIRSLTCGNGYIYCCVGNGRGNIYIGNDTLGSPTPSLNMIIVQYDLEGNIVRYQEMGGLSNIMQDITADAQGNILAAGWVASDIWV